MSLRAKKEPDGHLLLGLLRQTHDVVLKIRQNELRRYGLTPEQSAALMNVKALGDKASIVELSRRLFRKSNSTTVLVKRLEKRGLIRKTRDKYRKNTIRLSLTIQGQKCLQKAMREDDFNQVINKFEDKKRRQLCLLLEQLRDHALGTLGIDLESYSDFLGSYSDSSGKR
jgi:DNA-binding MarR family transcriptional regulator